MENSKNFNINIDNYSFGELLNILSIQIMPDSTSEEITKQIEASADHNIEIFQGLKKPEIADFFKNVKIKLIGDNKLSTNSENVITYKNLYNPISQNAISSDGDPYNQNSGAGNAINRKTVTKLLNIDTRFRKNYEKTIATDYLMDMPAINNVIEMTLSDLELPSTSYPLTASYQNNYFWIRTIDTNDVEHFYYIVLKEGNYYFISVINILNNIFLNLSLDIYIDIDLDYGNTGGIGEGTGITYLGVINDPSNNTINEIRTFEIKFNGPCIPGQTDSKEYTNETINGVDINKFYYSENTIDYKQLFGWMIGFRRSLYKEPSVDPILSSKISPIDYRVYYKSESIIDFSGPKYLYLILNDYNQSVNANFLTLSSNGMLPDNIMARISQKGQLFSIQSQNDFSVYSEPRYYYGPVNLSKLRVQLIDEYHRPVNLHNKDFSFTLRITTIYSIT